MKSNSSRRLSDKLLNKRSSSMYRIPKAQDGLMVNNNPFSVDGPLDQSMYQPLNTDPLTSFNPNANLVQMPTGQSAGLISDPSVMQDNSAAKAGFDAVGALPGIGKLALAGYNTYQMIKARRAQKKYEKSYKADLEYRKHDDDFNGFYHTPYEYQLGGPVDNAELNQFYNYYSKVEQANRTNSQMIAQGYKEQNQELTDLWKGYRNSAIQNYISSGVEGVKLAAKAMGAPMQEGGQVGDNTQVQYNDDIYSTDFNPTPIYQGTPTREVSDEGFDPDSDINDMLYEMAFEDIQRTEVDSDLINELFDLEMGNQQEETPADKLANQFRQMGITPSSIGTGQHNVGSKHYEGKAIDLGLNTSFGGDHNKMEQFKQWWDSGGSSQYPGVILRDERNKPEGQAVWSGPHYHLEYE